MRKEDAVTLNRQAVLDRLREQRLKQWVVARQVGVTKLTVNRWLTGRIRRVSRENLARLAVVLNCPEDSITFQDEADIRATQAEQSAAARSLVTKQTQTLFTKSDQMELYENLLKAVMHPNLPVADLAEIYSGLTFAASEQGKLDQVQQYARLTLDYALRSGNVDKEFSARTNLVTALGESGKLAAAIAGLRELAAAAESAGYARNQNVARLNLIYALRLQGDVREAIRVANPCIEYFLNSTISWGAVHALSNSSMLALEMGQFDLARELRRAAMARSPGDISVAERVSSVIFEQLVASLKGEEVDWPAFEAALPEFAGLAQRIEGAAVWPSVVLRRAGKLERARQFTPSSVREGRARVYEPPMLDEELARIAWAEGDRRKARRYREKANVHYRALGMGRRCNDDPSVEVGSQFEAPRRLKIIFELP